MVISIDRIDTKINATLIHSLVLRARERGNVKEIERERMSEREQKR